MQMIHLDTVISAKDTSLIQFQNHLMEGAIKTLSERIERYVPGRYNSLKDRTLDLLGYKRVWTAQDQYGFSEAGYMMLAIFRTAKFHNNKAQLLAVKKAFDSNCLGKAFVRVDQAPYGIVAIELYKEYKDLKYKHYADSMYQYLKGKNTEEFGILFIPELKYNHVDGIGVYNPFLVEYSTCFGCKDAYLLALSCFEKYCKFGVEKELGRPATNYSLRWPHEKGRLNWGRGFSWYTLGFCLLNEADFSETTYDMYKKYIDYIAYIYKRDHRFTKFINSEGGDIDLSATLPLVWFLQKKNIIQLSEKDILEYSKFMYNNIMFHSSGVFFDTEVQFTSSQRLSQAFMINIILLYQMSCESEY